MNDRTYNWHTPKNQIKSQPSFWADAGFGFTSLEATVDPALLKGMMKAARELVGAVHDHGARIGVRLHKLGVTIRLGSKATAKTVQKDSPDVVVIATGAVPSKPEIPGVER